jgi:hypothetical protein
MMHGAWCVNALIRNNATPPSRTRGPILPSSSLARCAFPLFLIGVIAHTFAHTISNTHRTASTVINTAIEVSQYLTMHLQPTITPRIWNLA